MVLEQGQRFTLRDGSLTLGTGVVTKVMPSLSEKERLSLVEGKKARQAAAAEK
jgi:elongation factor Tu